MEMGEGRLKNGGEEEEQPMVLREKLVIPSALSRMDADDVSTCKVSLVVNNNNNNDYEDKKKKEKKKKKKRKKRSSSIINIGESSFDSDDDDYYYEMLKKKWRKTTKKQKQKQKRGGEDDKNNSTTEAAVVDERRAAVLAYISSFAYKGGGVDCSGSTDGPTSPPPFLSISTPPRAVRCRSSSNNTSIRKEENKKKIVLGEKDREEPARVLKQPSSQLQHCSPHNAIASFTHTGGDGGGRCISKYFSHTSYNSPPPPHDGTGNDDEMSIDKQFGLCHHSAPVHPSEDKQEEDSTIMLSSSQQHPPRHTVPDIASFAYTGGSGGRWISKYFSHTSYNSPPNPPRYGTGSDDKMTIDEQFGLCHHSAHVHPSEDKQEEDATIMPPSSQWCPPHHTVPDVASFDCTGGSGGRWTSKYFSHTSYNSPSPPLHDGTGSVDKMSIGKQFGLRHHSVHVRPSEDKQKEDATKMLPSSQQRPPQHTVPDISSFAYNGGSSGRQISKYFSHTSCSSPRPPPPPHDGIGSDDKMSIDKQFGLRHHSAHVHPSEDEQEEDAAIMPPSSQQCAPHHTVPDVTSFACTGCRWTSKYFSHTSYYSPSPPPHDGTCSDDKMSIGEQFGLCHHSVHVRLSEDKQEEDATKMLPSSQQFPPQHTVPDISSFAYNGGSGAHPISKYFSHTSYNNPSNPPHGGTGSDDKMSIDKQFDLCHHSAHVHPSEDKQEEDATMMPPSSQWCPPHHTVPDIASFAYTGGSGGRRTSKYFSHTSYNSSPPSVVQQEEDAIRMPPPPQPCDGHCPAEAIPSANTSGRRTSRYFSNACGNNINGGRSIRHNEVIGDANGKLKVKKKVADSNDSDNKKKEQRQRTLSAKERFMDAYKRVPDNPSLRWKPPISPHSLLQEKYYESPWKVLIICILCNRTKGQEAGKVLEALFSVCCSPKETLKVPAKKIEGIIRELGLQRKRAEIIKRFSEEYLKEWNYVTELPGIGKYAADAYAIFCSGRWQEVMPVDRKLELYWKFLNKGGGQKQGIVGAI